MEVRFEYNLTGAGWAESMISVDGQSLRMAVSYLSDALGHMTEAVVRLLNGTEGAEVFFMDEPGEHRWLMRRRENDKVSIEIQWFDDWLSWGFADGDSGRVVFTAEVPLSEFAQQVKVALDKIIERYGLEGYKKEEWIEHKFPFKDYRVLKGMLSRNLSVAADSKA